MADNNNDSFGFGDLELDTAVAANPVVNKEENEDEGGSTVTGSIASAPSAPAAPSMEDLGNPDELLGDIKSSIEQMQSQMQDTYKQLNVTRLTGESNDGKVSLIMTATYVFEDIEFTDDAFADGPRELKWRIKEAFRDLMKKIQDRTQQQTMDLLQSMDIPDEIKNLGGEG